VLDTVIYGTQEIKQLEQFAEQCDQLNADVLMQRAGQAACDFLCQRWPLAKKIIVVCGAGNNGGDGYVLAKAAFARGLQVAIWHIGQLERLPPAAKNAHAQCVASGISVQAWHAQAEWERGDVLVDAICGTGLNTPLRPEVLTLIQQIQAQNCPIFSLDIPTGIDADTGNKLGGAIYATATMTFIAYKLGLFTGAGIACTGELVLNHLQLHNELYARVLPRAERLLTLPNATFLSPRERTWHKGLSGHVLIIGGEQGTSGAVRMAAEAALRVGAGLVSIATRKEHAALLNLTRPEIMVHGVAKSDELNELIHKATVIVLGPGLGQSPWAQALWQTAIASKKPLVVDADGLNLLSQQAKHDEHWILTPHPGEASRLLNIPIPTIQANRLRAAEQIQKRYGGVCILKGAGSIIVAEKELPAVCSLGNPGMATAGMGDVLSGVIGGLLAQGCPLSAAAKMSVYIHALAGDLAAQAGERGMVASDLFPYLRQLANWSGG
jgi:ADP-dependent NAD(P)H-hydrate dehydratase / NAD(P)H-hydrate epimerase